MRWRGREVGVEGRRPWQGLGKGRGNGTGVAWGTGRGPRRDRRSPWEEGRGWARGGAVDTSAGSGSPWPAGGRSSRGNPAAPPGSASGQGTTEGPMRGQAAAAGYQGRGRPSSREQAGGPTAWAELPHRSSHARPPVGGPAHCSNPVLSPQFKAARNTPHPKRLHPTQCSAGGPSEASFWACVQPRTFAQSQNPRAWPLKEVPLTSFKRSFS